MVSLTYQSNKGTNNQSKKQYLKRGKAIKKEEKKMTQKEFSERTGYTPTAEEFNRINEWYMNTDLNKDDFCKAWMTDKMLLSEIATKTILVRELARQREDMANYLIAKAEKWSAGDLREKAIEMIGEREYLRRKIEKGFNLCDVDKELLMEVLRG